MLARETIGGRGIDSKNTHVFRIVGSWLFLCLIVCAATVMGTNDSNDNEPNASRCTSWYGVSYGRAGSKEGCNEPKEGTGLINSRLCIFFFCLRSSLLCYKNLQIVFMLRRR